MKRIACIFVFLLASTAARAIDTAAWPSGPAAVLPKGEFTLSEDTSLAYDRLTLSDGTIITTAGHDFDLLIRQELVIEGNAVIRSFVPTQVPSTPSQAATGATGRSFERGPNTEGPATATKGNDGGQGSPGATGTPGLPGEDAGFISLRFEPNAIAKGMLLVRNTGGIGGQGGTGGAGGDGGDGQQGGRGRDGIIDCKSGPGNGGKGGDGGPGGVGGRAGDGGRGGTIILQVGSKAISDWLANADLFVDGGTPGQPGIGGGGGDPGQPGFGGRGSRFCQGKEADRMGAPGTPGDDTKTAITGENPGLPGRIKKL